MLFSESSCRRWRTGSRALLTAVFVVTALGTTQAAPVTYYFCGALNDAFGTHPVGTPFTGSFTYDDAQPLNTPVVPYRGDYTYTSVSVTMGGVTVTDNGTGFINLYNQSIDLFDLYTLNVSGAFGGRTLAPGRGISVDLHDLTGAVFSSPAIMPGNLSLSDFTTGPNTYLQLRSTSPLSLISRGNLTALSSVCQCTEPVCDDEIDCTDDSCGPEGCVHEPNDSICDDENACNGVETCDVGGDEARNRGGAAGSEGLPSGCLPGEDIVCNDDGLSCTANVCVGGGECDYPLMAGFCLIDGVCHADGDRNPPMGCRVCDSATDPSDWTLLPIGSSCDDELAACLINGVCVEFGGCLLEPHHELCDDNLPCTTDECTPIGCISQPDDAACNDGINCTLDRCIVGVGCQNTPDHTVCINADGLFCNGKERCVPAEGGCRPALSVPCEGPCDEVHDRCRRPRSVTRTPSQLDK